MDVADEKIPNTSIINHSEDAFMHSENMQPSHRQVLQLLT